ncbi:SLATT domain-containing protein [Undibacterium sp. WLX3042]|uniref:SLATT domain-containing protein n=1 Tax=Undibacterium sp. WLX3042 TaxID=3412686 RepID=UPI003C2C6FE5
MNKDDLLKHIAQTAYNVGFGAKKNFATYDIVAKMPGLISFISLAFGVYALVFEALNAKFFSASFIILGIVGMYITFYDAKKGEYAKTGVELTKLFNKLKILSGKVKAEQGALDPYIAELEQLENEYNNLSMHHQIMFSNWYAHYKFFWEHQIDWVDEQLKFRFFRDKIPLSLMLCALLIILTIVAIANETNLLHAICAKG